METSGTDFLSDCETQAPVSPLHLAVSSWVFPCVCIYLIISVSHGLMSLNIRQKRYSSSDLGLPRALWSSRGSLVVPPGSGRMQPRWPDAPQPGVLQRSSRVCLSAAAPQLLTHDSGLHTQKDSHTCCWYSCGHLHTPTEM